jgi:hypothetical protein
MGTNIHSQYQKANFFDGQTGVFMGDLYQRAGWHGDDSVPDTYLAQTMPTTKPRV